MQPTIIAYRRAVIDPGVVTLVTANTLSTILLMACCH